ncbi:MAG: tRNA 5-methoxyuridine(34)/uridine 5-oxyacetic acid(34) synthase CmoB [Methylococcus sp.]|nr:MAG: tRNA 5-methoxyuridine(34)/uridine 5-oxyacetic acid(34) synthase CmoB [Methylococcus sp.]
MIDLDSLTNTFRSNGLEAWAELLPKQLSAVLSDQAHGDFPSWLAALKRLPHRPVSEIALNEARVRAGPQSRPFAEPDHHLRSALEQFHPWRKGPYMIHGIHIDSEWRSDFKWDRLTPHISSLKNRRVLDVGCGNGYHCWRMAGAGAKLVIGVDPTLLSIVQFWAIRHFIGEKPVFTLPIGVESVPACIGAFDTVFSMGVLYHRRSPLDHLLELQGFLCSGGELVLETLVVDGDEGQTLVPEGRYAKMRNVWFIPSCPTLLLWLRRCGFRDIRLVDVSLTTPEEQRTTRWMRFHSLSDFLNPEDSRLTCEGLPAPRRAICIARKA